MRFATSLLALILCAGSVGAASSGLKPVDLRCERLTNPVGVDTPRPLLSWKLAPTASGAANRGQRQTAFEIQAASSARGLARGEVDLWDSGRIDGDSTIDIAYTGKPLASEQACFWRVRSYDRDGMASAWSEPASWTMGLLAASDWKAQWIGCDAFRAFEEKKLTWGKGVWVWHAADGEKPPQGERLFRASIEIPPSASVKLAQLWVASDNHAVVRINGTEAHKASGWQVGVLKVVTDRVRPGPNAVMVSVTNTGPDPAGLLMRLVLTLADGSVQELATTTAWESSADGKDWKPVRLVGPPGCAPWGVTKIVSDEVHTPPATLLRTTFRADKPIRRAILHASALGIADFHLNGQRVSDEWFLPGWTHYPARVHYRTYDVTARVRPGENALGAALGDGWFSGHVGYGHRRDHYGKKPRILAQLHISYEDGSEAIVTSGPDWKASTGPVLAQDFLMGETHDARLEQTGWDTVKFDASKWRTVDVGGEEVQPVREWHPGPPVIAFMELTPKSVTEPKPGLYVFDLGQNFSGLARLKVRGEPGQKITLRFAERLLPDGTAYTANYRSARSIDTYICSGRGTETWTPRFTFHGFQYVQVEGLAKKPSKDLITGVALGSDTPTAGSFACSDTMLNQLGSNTWWTQRANFLDIPTDCPQRDERLGWTGDAQMYIRTASLHADVQSFFQKWLKDLLDAQKPDGQFACVAPPLVAPDGGGPAWIDAGSVCPWTLYDVYGDRRALERTYPAMRKLVDSYKNRCSADLKPPAKFHCFGDWLSIKATTPNEVIFSAYFALTTKLAAQTAEVLGHADDAARYRQLFADIKAAFNRDYVDAAGRVRGDTQTAYVLALQFDLLDGAQREAAAKHLVADIEKHAGHLTTGFVGTKDLMLVLTKIGRTDVAYRLLHNDTFPSWGFSIRNGATTIWERWNGWTPEQGFGDAGMNSFAHYAFGAVYQWMVENIGGIRSTAPAFRRIAIAPVPDDKLQWARVSYDSINGPIVSAWKKDRGALHLDVTVPPNVVAEIRVPTANPDAITEGRGPAASAPGVKRLRTEKDAVVYEVGSGNYSFKAP